jgi:hypothetical protein
VRAAFLLHPASYLIDVEAFSDIAEDRIKFPRLVTEIPWLTSLSSDFEKSIIDLVP